MRVKMIANRLSKAQRTGARRPTHCAAAAASVLLATFVCAAEPPEIKSPLEPKDSLRHFQLDPGLKIELAAAEPEVVDPVAIRFDEHGRMWVVEMRDYPHGPAEGEAPLSRIRVLEDRDGDGYFETATTFADKLLFATGVQPWKGGAIVTLAGRVAYMKDTDGDGRADLGRNLVHRLRAGELATAGQPSDASRWTITIYVANGLRGGAVVDARKTNPHPNPLPEGEGTKPVNINQMDFRFDPRRSQLRSSLGRGTVRPGVGRLRQPLRGEQSQSGEARGAGGPLHQAQPVPGGAGRGPRRGGVWRNFACLPAQPGLDHVHAARRTVHGGLRRAHLSRRRTCRDEYRGNAFTCEPTGNLVHREIMRPKGATFESRPAYDDASSWPRPTNGSGR